MNPFKASRSCKGYRSVNANIMSDCKITNNPMPALMLFTHIGLSFQFSRI